MDVPVTADGEAQFVVFWYELVFPGYGKAPGDVYSTSPEEECTGGVHQPWTRAWNQVSYGLHHEQGGLKSYKAGETLKIGTEFRYDRLWFTVDPANSKVDHRGRS